MSGFSIIIPIYNEAQNIESLINEIYTTLDNSYKFELLLVNDKSTDNTIEVVKNLQKKFNIILINNPKNKGQSYSITHGIKKSIYKTIVTLDGDGQNNPEDIPKLLKKYYSRNDLYLVGGIRKKRQDRFIKILSSRIANKIRSIIFNDGCNDTGCSLKVFDKKIFLEFPFFTGIHRFLPSLFTGYGYQTFFINVDHRVRIKGSSNYGTLDRLFRGIIDIIKVKNIIKKHNEKK